MRSGSSLGSTRAACCPRGTQVTREGAAQEHSKAWASSTCRRATRGDTAPGPPAGLFTGNLEALDMSARRQRCGLSISTDIRGLCCTGAGFSPWVAVHVLHKGQSDACVHHKQVTRREESSCSLNPSTSRRTVGEAASTFRSSTVVAPLSPFPPNSTDAGSTLKISPRSPRLGQGKVPARTEQLQNTRLLLDLAYKPHFHFRLHAEKEKTALSQTQHMCETEKHPGDAALITSRLPAWG